MSRNGARREPGTIKVFFTFLGQVHKTKYEGWADFIMKNAGVAMIILLLGMMLLTVSLAAYRPVINAGRATVSLLLRIGS